MMTKHAWSALALGAATLLASVPALAHHSYAMFDDKKVVDLQATVKDWQFTNPHSWLEVVVSEAGKDVAYSVEGSSPNSLLRRGWTPATFKPGDKIKLSINPLRDGRKGGSFVKAILPDGTVLTQFRQN